MQYTFGDSDIAARRLKVVADVFAPSTRAFLLDTVTDKPRLAVELGCGPGYSTHLLADVLECDHIVGLDNSEHFISLARKTATERVSFCLHDVTSMPFPVQPADLIYCRFLLTHLKDPRDVVARWGTQLRPNGILLLDEVESIRTDNTVFEAYIDIVAAMLRHQSNELYVGPLLSDLEDADTLKRRTSQVRSLPVSNRQAATMFSLNIQSWKHQPFVRRNYPSESIERLEADLKALAEQADTRIEIEWGLRQIVLQRA